MPALVSIIIPAYNAERWIEETIISAINQTWARKEVIIVNDGSTDNTLHIAKKYESKTVKVLSQDNMGASSARNSALFIAQGDFIQWLDADDLLSLDKISNQLRSIENILKTKVLLSSAFGKFYTRHQKATFTRNSLWQNLLPVEWLLIKFIENAWMSNSSWLISRTLINLCGPWNEDLSLDDDGEYSCRLVANCSNILFIENSKCYYRQINLHSYSRNNSEDARQSLFLSISMCIGYLLNIESSERAKMASLKYLQRWLYHFYPEKPKLIIENDEILKKASNLAKELGGNLLPPKLSCKYKVIRKIFGRQFAMHARDVASKAKITAHLAWDHMNDKISRVFLNH